MLLLLRTKGAIKRRDEKKEHRSPKPRKTPKQVKVTYKRKGHWPTNAYCYTIAKERDKEVSKEYNFKVREGKIWEKEGRQMRRKIHEQQAVRNIMQKEVRFLLKLKAGPELKGRNLFQNKVVYKHEELSFGTCYFPQECRWASRRCSPHRQRAGCDGWQV